MAWAVFRCQCREVACTGQYGRKSSASEGCSTQRHSSGRCKCSQHFAPTSLPFHCLQSKWSRQMASQIYRCMLPSRCPLSMLTPESLLLPACSLLCATPKTLHGLSIRAFSPLSPRKASTSTAPISASARSGRWPPGQGEWWLQPPCCLSLPWGRAAPNFGESLGTKTTSSGGPPSSRVSGAKFFVLLGACCQGESASSQCPKHKRQVTFYAGGDCICMLR